MGWNMKKREGFKVPLELWIGAVIIIGSILAWMAFQAATGQN